MGYLLPVQERIKGLKRSRADRISETSPQWIEQFAESWIIADPNSTNWFPSQNLNRVIDLALLESDFTTTLSEIVSRFDSLDVPRHFAYLDPSTHLEELAVCLHKVGYRLGNAMSVLVHDLKTVQESTSGLRVAEVTPELIADLEQVLSYHGTQEVMWRGSTVGAVERSEAHVLIAYSDDVPAATGTVNIHDNVAYLSTATTVPEFRGRGAQHDLIRARLELARNLGCDFAFVETYDWAPSYTNILNCGFVESHKRLIYRYEADAEIRSTLVDTLYGHDPR